MTKSALNAIFVPLLVLLAGCHEKASNGNTHKTEINSLLDTVDCQQLEVEPNPCYQR